MRKDFIPRPYKKEALSIRMDCEKLEQIDKLLAEYNLNRSEFINRCVDFGLQAIAKDKKH